MGCCAMKQASSLHVSRNYWWMLKLVNSSSIHVFPRHVNSSARHTSETPRSTRKQ